MKYFLFLIPFLLLPSQVASQKSYKDEFKFLATYQFTYQPDSTDVHSKKSEEMVLYLGDKSSRFSSTGKAMKDEMLRSRKKGNRSMADFSRLQSQVPRTSLYYSIFKYYPSSQLSFTEDIAMDKFRYEQEINLFQWSIEEERKEISGYQAQKATTSFSGRDYIAWFTAEIPIPDGPYKFNGLPGLILEIRDTEQHYAFELMQFLQLEKPEEVEFNSKDFISTNRKKFLQVKQEYDKDPMGSMEKAGLKFGMEQDVRDKMHREHLVELKKQNNPLELE